MGHEFSDTDGGISISLACVFGFAHVWPSWWLANMSNEVPATGIPLVRVQYLMLSFPRGAGTNNNLLVAPFAAV